MSLTNNDLTKISELMQSNLRDYQGRLVSYIDKRLTDFEKKIEVEINQLPTKEEFNSKTDKIIGNQVRDRQELDLLSSKVYDDIEPRVKALETTSK